jgi:hypothetical protein
MVVTGDPSQSDLPGRPRGRPERSAAHPDRRGRRGRRALHATKTSCATRWSRASSALTSAMARMKRGCRTRSGESDDTPWSRVIVEARWRKQKGLFRASAPCARARVAHLRALGTRNEPQPARLTMTFCSDDERLASLNASSAARTSPPTCCRFPDTPGYLGDVAIAYGVTAAEARAQESPIATTRPSRRIHGPASSGLRSRNRARGAHHGSRWRSKSWRSSASPILTRNLRAAKRCMSDPDPSTPTMPTMARRLSAQAPGAGCCAAAERRIRSAKASKRSSRRASAKPGAAAAGARDARQSAQIRRARVVRRDGAARRHRGGRGKTPLAQLVAIFARRSIRGCRSIARRSTIPIGFVHIKDVLALVEPRPTAACAGPTFHRRIKRELLFVPPSMPARDLLLKMQTTHMHLALVIDEYGGTDGLVSIEDLSRRSSATSTTSTMSTRRRNCSARPTAATTPMRARSRRISRRRPASIWRRRRDEEIDTLGGLVVSLASPARRWPPPTAWSSRAKPAAQIHHARQW